MAKAAPQAVGQPIRYDPDFNGPLKNRSCTDIICLLLFLVFIACWAGIGWYAIVNGDPSTLLVPRDSSGRRCGVDSDVKDRPYLFFFDLTKCFAPTTPITGCRTEQVCVKSCPDENFLKDVHDTEKAVLFCKYGISVYNEDDCPTWYLVSESVQKRCIPSLSQLNRTFIKDVEEYLKDGKDLVDTLKKAIDNIKLLSDAEEVTDILSNVFVSLLFLSGVLITFFFIKQSFDSCRFR